MLPHDIEHWSEEWKFLVTERHGSNGGRSAIDQAQPSLRNCFEHLLQHYKSKCERCGRICSCALWPGSVQRTVKGDLPSFPAPLPRQSVGDQQCLWRSNWGRRHIDQPKNREEIPGQPECLWWRFDCFQSSIGGRWMEGHSHFEFQELEQNVPATILDNIDYADPARRSPLVGRRINHLMVCQEELPQAQKSRVWVRLNRVDTPYFQCQVGDQFTGTNDQS